MLTTGFQLSYGLLYHYAARHLKGQDVAIETSKHFSYLLSAWIQTLHWKPSWFRSVLCMLDCKTCHRHKFFLFLCVQHFAYAFTFIYGWIHFKRATIHGIYERRKKIYLLFPNISISSPLNSFGPLIKFRLIQLFSFYHNLCGSYKKKCSGRKLFANNDVFHYSTNQFRCVRILRST